MASIYDYMQKLRQGEYTQRPSTSLISDTYDKRIEGKRQELKNLLADYDTSAAKLPEAYQPLRNNAYVNDALAQKRRQEDMANIGYSSAGGTFKTLEQRDRSTLANLLGSADRQQQDALDRILSERRGAELATNQAITGIESERANALLEQQRYEDQLRREESQRALQQQQYEQSRAFQQQQFDAAQKQQAMDNAYRMYAAGIITADQYEQMTGIRPQPIPRGSGGAPRIENDPEFDGTGVDTTTGKYYVGGKETTAAQYNSATGTTAKRRSGTPLRYYNGQWVTDSEYRNLNRGYTRTGSH